MDPRDPTETAPDPFGPDPSGPEEDGGADGGGPEAGPEAGDPFEPDVVARLARLAGGAAPLPRLLSEDGAVVVCFAGADAAELREARDLVAGRPAWALVVLAPRITPLVMTRNLDERAIARVLEQMAVRASAAQRRHCVAGAVHALLGLEDGDDNVRVAALSIADTLLAHGAYAARQVKVQYTGREPATAGADGLAAGALMAAAEVVGVGGTARAALVVAPTEGGTTAAVVAATEGGTVVASSGALGMSGAELLGLF